MNVVIIAKAILALKEILDSILGFIKERASEAQIEKIERAEHDFEERKTNRQGIEAARKIQASYGRRNRNTSTKLSDDSEERK